MDKQKKIEEIADALYNSQYEYDLSNPFEVAKVVIDLGYRKIPENAVVLTREELNDLEYKAYARGVNSFNTLHEKQLAKVRKKTAEKFADRLVDFFVEKDGNNDLCASFTISEWHRMIRTIFDEICKEMVDGK